MRGCFKNKDILNIIIVYDWKTHIKPCNDEFRRIYYISFEPINSYGVRPWSGRSIRWYLNVKVWYLNNRLHRSKGPARIWVLGCKEWWLNGKLHRPEKEGPAKIWANGSKEWWLNGKLHRTDGPAIENANGDKEWWLNDKIFTEKEFNKKIMNE